MYAESTYFGRKEEIRNTHAAITVSGRVVDDAGKQLAHVRDGYGTGIVTITGIRDSVRFQMESEGQGDSTDLLCDADWFSDTFSVHIDNVREATLAFTREGYAPASLRVVVPRGKNAAAQPVVITDAVIVMHRDNTVAASEGEERGRSPKASP